jgi:hypothetical protein
LNEVLQVIKRHDRPIDGLGLADVLGRPLERILSILDRLAERGFIREKGAFWASSAIVLTDLGRRS